MGQFVHSLPSLKEASMGYLTHIATHSRPKMNSLSIPSPRLSSPILVSLLFVSHGLVKFSEGRGDYGVIARMHKPSIIQIYDDGHRWESFP